MNVNDLIKALSKLSDEDRKLEIAIGYRGESYSFVIVKSELMQDSIPAGFDHKLITLDVIES